MGRPSYTHEEFLQLARLTYGDRYDYSKAQYTHSQIKIFIGCKHSGFFITPAAHLNGSECKHCSKEFNASLAGAIVIQAWYDARDEIVARIILVNRLTENCVRIPSHDDSLDYISKIVVFHDGQVAQDIFNYFDSTWETIDTYAGIIANLRTIPDKSCFTDFVKGADFDTGFLQGRDAFTVAKKYLDDHHANLRIRLLREISDRRVSDQTIGGTVAKIHSDVKDEMEKAIVHRTGCFKRDIVLIDDVKQFALKFSGSRLTSHAVSILLTSLGAARGTMYGGRKQQRVMIVRHHERYKTMKGTELYHVWEEQK